MPFINGRYYMNPTYGLAMERARNRSGLTLEQILDATSESLKSHSMMPLIRVAQAANSEDDSPDATATPQEPRMIPVSESRNKPVARQGHSHKERQSKTSKTQRRSMGVSPEGVQFVARHETPDGRPALHVYKDTGGYPTIGYGHNLPSEDFSGGITKGEAVALLKKDLRHAVNAVNQSLQEPVTQPV